MHADLNPSICMPRRRAKRSLLLCWPVLLVSAALPAHAMAEACQPSDSAFLCRMRSVLTFLDTAAVLLGMLLVLAISAAVWAYRRKPRKLTPDDISSDTK